MLYRVEFIRVGGRGETEIAYIEAESNARDGTALTQAEKAVNDDGNYGAGISKIESIEGKIIEFKPSLTKNN